MAEWQWEALNPGFIAGGEGAVQATLGAPGS